MIRVPIGVSARHIHLSEEHIETLFGSGFKLNFFKQLSQPHLFAAEEVVVIEGPRGRIGKVRVVGPARPRTQLEISRTDAIALGLSPPVRESGNLEGTPGMKIIGSAGELELAEGVIVAARHIHFHTKEARQWGIVNKQKLRVKLFGERPLTVEDVVARVADHYVLDMHIDTDEANAAGVKTGDWGMILLDK